jgi:hypothetical protein
MDGIRMVLGEIGWECVCVCVCVGGRECVSGTGSGCGVEWIYLPQDRNLWQAVMMW